MHHLPSRHCLLSGFGDGARLASASYTAGLPGTVVGRIPHAHPSQIARGSQPFGPTDIAYAAWLTGRGLGQCPAATLHSPHWPKFARPQVEDGLSVQLPLQLPVPFKPHTATPAGCPSPRAGSPSSLSPLETTCSTPPCSTSPTNKRIPPGKARKGWQPTVCELCLVSLLTPTHQDAHLKSKEHHRRLQEREQRAILVRGVSEGATVEDVRALFSTYQLAPNAVQFVPASSGQSGHWHILFNSVDDARAAAKDPSVAMRGCAVSMTLAMPPHHCAVCNTTVTSAAQLRQHLRGNRHREELQQRAARCGLLLRGVPPEATEVDIRALFADCEMLEGGLLLIHSADESFQTAHVALTSQPDVDEAFAILEANPTVLGASVQVARSPTNVANDESLPATASQVVPSSGLKTAGEAHLLVCNLLYEHNVEDVQTISPALFSRLASIFLSCIPCPLVNMQPRSRFFVQFEEQAGSRNGLLPLQQALAILQPLEADWAFPLPAGAREWLQRKMAKYCPSPEVDLLTKGRFAQVRNLIGVAYEVTRLVMEKIAANRQAPPSPCRSRLLSLGSSQSNPEPTTPRSITSDELVAEWDVDNQRWDDTSLDVVWAL
eukprot:GGOE01054632.1.p1 GENE.GGOE01054632.1~~GGOE01054632.1.p1  ORF type:complete len:605 (+),score=142.46 GGOE01054632.1:521-2335(+)